MHRGTRLLIAALTLAFGPAVPARALEQGEITWYLVTTSYTFQSDVATAHTTLRERVQSTGSERVLKAGQLSPHLSFGAGALWFSDNRGIIRRTTSGAETRITVGDDREPSPSADGSQVVFSRRHPNGRSDLYVVSSNGSGLRRLSYGGGERPAWSSTGAIAFARTVADNRDIYVTDASGVTPRRITAAGSFDDEPAWSPPTERTWRSREATSTGAPRQTSTSSRTPASACDGSLTEAAKTQAGRDPTHLASSGMGFKACRAMAPHCTRSRATAGSWKVNPAAEPL
jgi:hypothetical protein